MLERQTVGVVVEEDPLVMLQYTDQVGVDIEGYHWEATVAEGKQNCEAEAGFRKPAVVETVGTSAVVYVVEKVAGEAS
jgi:hypothetical protein